MQGYSGDGPRICALLFLHLWYMLSLSWPDGVLSELLYGYNIVLMSETIKGLVKKSIKWKVAFKSKGLKAKPGKAKVMVSGRNTTDGLSKW